MSSTPPPAQRPSVPGSLGNHEARTRALERQPPPPTGLEEITSSDGSVTITDPTGPTVDLVVGGVKEILSSDSSVTITNPTGPTVDLSVAGTPYVIFTGNSLGAGDYCEWDPTPWADSGDAIAAVDGGDTRLINVIPGLYQGIFNLDSGANFARYYTGAATTSDILSAGADGTVDFPVPPLAGATWMGSNDGFNRDVGEINLVFPFRSTIGNDELRVLIAYLRAAGFVAPNFSLTIVKIA